MTIKSNGCNEDGWDLYHQGHVKGRTWNDII